MEQNIEQNEPIKAGVNSSAPEVPSLSVAHVRLVSFVTNPLISHVWGTNGIAITANGTYQWSLLT